MANLLGKDVIQLTLDKTREQAALKKKKQDKMKQAKLTRDAIMEIKRLKLEKDAGKCKSKKDKDKDKNA